MRPSLRLLRRSACVLAASWLALVGAAYVVLRQGPATIEAVMPHVPGPAYLLLPFETLWRTARAGTLRPGDVAPDFDLPLLDGSARVRLSDFAGQRPVVLVFGSYT